MLPPTAVQADEDEHATLPKKAPCDPAGVGVDCTVHFVPSERSASGSPPAKNWPVAPTATQAEADVHETENSVAPGLALVGCGWMLQLAPSQRSIRDP
jgi:hypothetical protein